MPRTVNAEVLLQALRALLANRTRSILTMLGVIIGVASVILLVALGEGAKRYIQQELTDLGSNLLIITPGKVETSGGPFPIGSVNPLTVEDARSILKRCPSVQDVAPLVLGGSRIKYRNRSRDTTVIGATESFPQMRSLRVDVGSFFSDEDGEARRRVCVIGRRVKREIFSESNPLGEWVRIGGTKYRVIGIMARKGVSLGLDLDDIVFIPVESAMDLFDVDRLFEILAKARSEEAIDRAKREITEVLLNRHDGQEDFTLTSQNAILSSLLTILTTFTWILGGIAAVSLLVGGVGIMNIMLVSVTERTLEIGLRKAVGARRGDILSQFVVEAVTVSLLGGLVGVVLGNGGALLLGGLIPALPVSVSLWSVALGFGFSVAVGVFFGVYPAYRASVLDPIEALRFE
ncbi:MAG TPA: ABC transporter permease [Candidatus Polarisedimenticolia bacterium]|nr:ABC transporter permease [Candidatus Polarisedimenticolia bacterium]